MIETKTTAEYVIPCPRCGEKHIFREAYVDRMIDCECGFECYAFAVNDFRIIMSKSEAENAESDISLPCLASFSSNGF